MKRIFNILAAALLLTLTSCVLDLYPITGYSEGNVTVEETSGESQYTTRADMEGLRSSMYNSWIKDIQEKGYNDWLIITECRSDNAYCGTSTVEIMNIEANKCDADNSNNARDWNWYLGQVSNANNIICNIDRIHESDPTLTETECNQWKAEAMIWRAFNWLRLAQCWGNVPLVTTIPPAITAENVEEVYSEYYPAASSAEAVYAKVIEDLDFACKNAPNVDGGDKSLLSKAVAHGLLARLYAEDTPVRDWGKVVSNCEAIESMGFALEGKYGDLWYYDDEGAKQNSTEAIWEIHWTKSSGQWYWMMFHRNAYSPESSYSWAKWVTPSRNIIAAYDAAGDTERKNASIIYDECTWSNYYPSNEYAFMHKVPCNATSNLLMRLGEIYLLHAEGLCGKNDLSGATAYVNKVRSRAGLKDISVPGSQDAMVDAILDERRLELAFEGFRFYDLVRYGKAAEVHDAMPLEDSYWQQRRPLTKETIIFPIPQTQIDNNPNLVQNPGY